MKPFRPNWVPGCTKVYILIGSGEIQNKLSPCFNSVPSDIKQKQKKNIFLPIFTDLVRNRTVGKRIKCTVGTDVIKNDFFSS